ncbi:type VII secretion target [Actinoplanes sp. NPDC051633]|uniref:type VII secretion target n=1 Tax=Actinoplanes sp. NPDC051633 TaxID=3155670 RepID=UPI00342168B9
MAEQFQVRHQDLVTHAAAVGTAAARVSTVAQAGAAVRAGNEAYGKLCTMVPAMLNGLQDVLVEGIDSAAESLRDTGSRLRATAAGYEASDKRGAGDLRSRPR